MKVVIPKQAKAIKEGGIHTKGVLYYTHVNGTTVTKDASNDLYFMPDNILFDASLLIPPTSQPQNPNKGDVWIDTANSTAYMYCSDNGWGEDASYDGWEVIPNFLFEDELQGSMKTFIKNGGTYQQYICSKNIKLFSNYDSSQDYTAGDIVECGLIYANNGVVSQNYGVPYKCIADVPSSEAKAPFDDPLHWERLPFYNQLALFDKYLNTILRTRNQNWNLKYENLSDVDFAAILNPKGTKAKFIWENNETSKTVELDLTQRVTQNFYEYFFKDFKYRSIAMSEKQLVNVNKLTIQLDGDANSGAGVIVGKAFDIGITQYGYKKQSRDFSKKITTTDGYDYLQKGNQSKKYIIKLLIHNNLASDVFDLLQGLSSTLCLYVLEDGEWVFGYYKDLYMIKQNSVLSEYELEINGVI